MKKQQVNIDYKDLEFLAAKSAIFIEKQVTSYRQKHANSGTVITVIALFIPFFLVGLDESYLIIKILSVLPILLLLWAIILLINILRTKSLDHGFKVDKFDSFVNEKYESILLYEIGANKSSFNDNEKILDITNKNYNFAIRLTVISIIISTILLVYNKFDNTKNDNLLNNFLIKNSIFMVQENNNKSTSSDGGSKNITTNTETKREIPYVPPQERTNLNEGANPQPFTRQNESDKK